MIRGNRREGRVQGEVRLNRMMGRWAVLGSQSRDWEMGEKILIAGDVGFIGGWCGVGGGGSAVADMGSSLLLNHHQNKRKAFHKPIYHPGIGCTLPNLLDGLGYSLAFRSWLPRPFE